jgi:hypothetical protein
VIRILIREAHVEPAVGEHYEAMCHALRQAIADDVRRAVAGGRLGPVPTLTFVTASCSARSTSGRPILSRPSKRRSTGC